MNPVLLNNIDHATLRVAIRAGADHGDSVNQLPIFPSEFEEAQRCFPIIFRRNEGGIQAFALLGLDRDENLFLNGDRWTSAYVPAIHRRGPFSIGVAKPALAGDAPGEPMIHVDLDDPRVGAADGLEDAGILQPISLQISLNAEDGYELPDLLVVDQAALGALTSERLERLHRSGLLRAATMAASSLRNVQQLIDLKNRKQAAS